MKKQIILVPLLVLLAFNLKAQEPDPTYLNKALQQLESGNCDAAQLYYNAYKELTGDSKPSVQALIDACGNPNKTYKVGDQMTVGKKTYTVAYVRDEGKHGLAVFNAGWTHISLTDRTMKTIPTFEELEVIYQNRDQIRLYDIYWSCTLAKTDSESYYKAKDFSTGKVLVVRHTSEYEAVKLLIHRF